MAMSVYLSDTLVKLLFKNTGTLSALANVYVGLFTTQADCCQNGAEVSGNNYSRVAVAAASWTQLPATGSRIQNAATVTFPAPSASWGAVTGVGLFDASSAGNLLFAGPLEPAQTVDTTTPPLSLLAGQIQVDLCCNC
jgi:hypothetical protein